MTATWPVLEDEWLHIVGRAGWRLPADVLVGLLRRHRSDATRWARVVRVGGPVVPWLLAHEPALRGSPTRRAVPDTSDLPALAVAPQLVGVLDAGPEATVQAVLGGLTDGTFGFTHRAVLINFVARARADTLETLAAALAAADVPPGVAGLAQSLADLAGTRQRMLEELQT